MLKKLIQGLAIMFLLMTAPRTRGQSWYGVDGPVPLTIDLQRVTIKFDDTLILDSQQVLLNAIDRIVSVLDDPHLIDGFVACSLSTGMDYDEFLDSLDLLNGIYLVEPYYRDMRGAPHLVGEGFCVAFDPNVTGEEIDSINALFNVVADKEILHNILVLKNTDSSEYRVVELANAYYALDETIFSHPDFSASIKLDSYRLYDYYHPNQPHIKKVIGSFDSATVWDFAGLQQPVTVAVIDDGIVPHEDLPASRIVQGYDYLWGDTIVEADEHAHGIACAGIIAASHATDSTEADDPNTGVISMNPYAVIMPVRIFAEWYWPPATESDVAACIKFAWSNGASILSNSWSYTDPDYSSPIMKASLDSAYEFGRGDLGCPLIFSSGNSADTFPWQVAYPGNYDVCFAVGALRLDDYRWDYSQYGWDLDIVAPSGDIYCLGDVWTLDQMADTGWNPGLVCEWDADVDYLSKFGGTSAACPVVAGVASLILSKDPTLPVDTVYKVLSWSAGHDVGGTYIKPPPPSPYYGYGRVDAFRAILSLSHGDVDNNGAGPNVADLTYLVDFLFRQGPDPFPSVLLGDCDCGGGVNVADITYVYEFLFAGGPSIPKPCFEN